MKNRTIAVDLAKNVFQIGVSDRPGHVEKTYRLSRAKFLGFFANQELATVVMEACGSAHYWGRKIRELGHTVVLISPQYVTPYVRRNKTDRTDVKGLVEAYRDSDIHPVPIKTLAQQQLTSLHRIRSAWMRTRTARINTVRGLLREFGYVIPTGADHLVPGVMELIEDADVVIPSVVREMFHQVCGEIRELESRLRSVEQELKTLARQMPEVARLTSIPGIGLLTATAMVGFVGNIKRFRTSRHFASYLGLTPRNIPVATGDAWAGSVSKVIVTSGCCWFMGAVPCCGVPIERAPHRHLSSNGASRNTNCADTTRRSLHWPTSWRVACGRFGTVTVTIRPGSRRPDPEQSEYLFSELR